MAVFSGIVAQLATPHTPVVWRTRFECNQARDQRVYEQLKSAGWDVVVIWEHEVRRGLDSPVHRILRRVGRGNL